MGFSKENYRKIKEEYEGKYLRAREDARNRRAEVHQKLPEVEEIDRKLAGVGFAIFDASLSGDKSKIEEISASHRALLKKREMILQSNGFAPDYTEIRYECAECADTGTVEQKMCRCMIKKLIKAGLESSGMGDLIERQSFENFDLSYYKGEAYTRMKAIYDMAKRLSENFDAERPQNVLMLGGTGLGKTHLSSAMAKVIIEKGNDVYYATATGLFSDYEMNRFGSGMTADATGETDKYLSCDLLIIDDLGTEVVNQFTASCLYDLINARLNRKKSTIISTNFTREEIRKKYTDRIYSRIFGEYLVWPFAGSDIREQKLMRK